MTLNERIDCYFRDIALSTTLDKAIELTSLFLERPVAVIDPSMTHIGHYPDRPTGDGDWDTLLRTGHVPLEYASATRQINALPTPPGMLQRCMYSPANACEMEKYRCTLTLGRSFIGGMMVLGDGRPFVPEDITAMQVACQTLSACLHNRSDTVDVRSNKQHSLLCALLTSDTHSVLNDMEKLHPDLFALEGRPMAVGFTSPRLGDYALAPFWQRTLASTFPDGQVIQHEGSLLFFFPLGELPYETFTAALSVRLDAIHMQAGLSDAFTSFYDFKTQFENAHQAFLPGSRAAPKKTLYPVCEYRLQLLAQTFRQSSAARSLCHPAAVHLMEHDLQNGTRYCEILRTYLVQFHNYSLAAQALYMHRNTLTYHLERIGQLLGADLNDPQFCQEMLFSLLLLETEPVPGPQA